MVHGTREQAPYERITEEQFAFFAVTRIEDSTDEGCTSGACPVRRSEQQSAPNRDDQGALCVVRGRASAPQLP
jgi:hypothetical protein